MSMATKNFLSTLPLHESSLNLISESTRIEGNVTFDEVSRFHGVLIGEAHAREGSTLVLCESSVVEGDIYADTLFVDGYVRGNIQAKTKVIISSSGRVIGNIETPSLKLEFGAHFEGRSTMERLAEKVARSNSNPAPETD